MSNDKELASMAEFLRYQSVDLQKALHGLLTKEKRCVYRVVDALKTRADSIDNEINQDTDSGLDRHGRPVNEFKRGVIHAWGHSATFIRGLAYAHQDPKKCEVFLEAADKLDDIAGWYAEMFKDRI